MTLTIGVVLTALLLSVAQAHVQLLYPPATLNLDFLDTFRTKGICGHEASGAEQTEEWKLPMYDANTTTEFEAGSNVTVFWALHYAHQGGWLFELYNKKGQLTSTWNQTDHWDCVSDSTQQRATLTMPTDACDGCILRMRRQALEWGVNYRFHSCAMVNIVKKPEDACNGCSGHGRCVRGKCRCDSSEEKGFWYGDYCESQNECEEDDHCGRGGVCVDSGNITPPGKQCYCKEGWFGSETKPLEGSYIASRNCSRRTRMKLGDPEKWVDEYDFELSSVPKGNFKLYYSVNTRRGEIEFAVRAKTANWAAFGFRPIASGKKPTKKGKKSKKEKKEDEEETETQAEGDGAESEGGLRRRALRTTHHMPEIQEEARYRQRSLLDHDDSDEESHAESTSEPSITTTKPRNKKKKKDTDYEEEEEETEAEGQAEGAGTGDDDGLCEDGKPTTVTFDAGTHGLAKRKRRSERSLLSDEMPSLQSERMESDHGAKTGRSLKEKRSLSETPTSEGDDTEEEPEEPEEPKTNRRKPKRSPSPQPQAEGDEPETQAEGGEEVEEIEEDFVAEVIGEGTECENVATTSDAHPMINQDIFVVYAKEGMFRIHDSFTPSRAKPLPDSFYGGEDGVLDAVGSEIDGYTNVKFKRKLTTVDANADYCILEDVQYLMIYAYGQATRRYTHIPDSGLETGRASNKRFYGVDELKFHGGGIGTTFEGRGVLGAVNFFDEPKEEAPEGSCIESTQDGYDCMQEELGGGYILHWTVESNAVSFAIETDGTGWAALGFPETPGVMIGAEAVIGLGGDESSVLTYRLEQKAAPGIIPDRKLFRITGTSIEQDDDSTLVKFKRRFDSKFDGTGEVDLLAAYNPTVNDIAYHGPTTRGGFTVKFS